MFLHGSVKTGIVRMRKYELDSDKNVKGEQKTGGETPDHDFCPFLQDQQRFKHQQQQKKNTGISVAGN